MFNAVYFLFYIDFWNIVCSFSCCRVNTAWYCLLFYFLLSVQFLKYISVSGWNHTPVLTWTYYIISISNKIKNKKYHTVGTFTQSNRKVGPSWSWSYDSWIYNYLCNQCLSPLKLWVRTPFMARCTRYIMWPSLSEIATGRCFFSGNSFPPPIKLTVKI
jgi:hypothetical protein